MSSTSMQAVPENVKKTDNGFNFLSVMYDLVGNKSFAKQKHETLQGTKSTEYNRIWQALSAIGQDIGGEFKQNIDNYIDDIANIDLCKVSALKSIATMLGLHYTIFDNIQTFPVDILKLIDVLSIRKDYLASSSKVNSEMAHSIWSQCSCDISLSVQQRIAALNEARLSSLHAGFEAVSAQASIDDQCLDAFVSCTFRRQLDNVLCSTYNDSLSTLVFQHLSSEILDGFELDNDKVAEMAEKKFLYSIDESFDPEKEVDKIEAGETEYDDYSNYEKEVLDIEIRRRAEPFSALELQTRYKYYKEKKLQEYSNFIQDQYFTYSSTYSNASSYAIDSNYFVFNGKELSTTYVLQDGQITINQQVVGFVISQLARIVSSIRSIRQNIKTQCQKHFMKGTFLLLSYVINEYLKTNVVQNISQIQPDASPTFDCNTTYSSLVEYIDPVEYFNISASPLDERYSTSQRYWEVDSTLSAIGAIDSTNIFEAPPTVKSNAFAFNIQQLSAFYHTMLHNKFASYISQSLSSMPYMTHLDQFLSYIFDIGADDTYKDDNGTYFISSDDLSGCYAKTGGLTLLDASLHYDGQSKTTLNATDISVSMSVDSLSVAVPLNMLSLQISADIEYQQISVEHECSATVQATSAALCSQQISVLMSDEEPYEICMAMSSWHEDREVEALSTWTAISAATIAVAEVPEQQVRCSCQTSAFQLLDEDFTRRLELVGSCTIEVPAQSLSSETIEEADKGKPCSFQICCSIEPQDIESRIQTASFMELKKKLYDEYSADLTSSFPYYYFKNARHSSYQIHPYLKMFLEKEDYSYPIQNVANIVQESVASQIKDKIDQLIDEDGYLISLWKNPLGSNQDYLSRYESSTNLNDNGVEDPVVDYDGLFYPPACKQLQMYPHQTVAALVEGSQCLAVYGQSDAKLITNYYYGSDLTFEDKQAISCKICNMSADIIKEAFHSTEYGKHITRYGIDIFQNAYTLVKDDEGNGTLWIRLKDHPLAFPAYVLNADDGEKSFLNDCQQVHFEDDGEDNVFILSASCHNLDASKKLVPDVMDFCFSNDKIRLMANISSSNGELSTVLSEVKIEHDDKLNIDKLRLLKLGDIECITYGDKRFGCFYNDGSSFGAISYKVSNDNIDVELKFFDAGEQKLETIQQSVQLHGLVPLDGKVCIDCASDGVIALAYLAELDRSMQASTYAGSQFKYGDAAEYTRASLDKFIVVEKLSLLGDILQHDGRMLFNGYSDIGFFGVLPGENYISGTMLAYNSAAGSADGTDLQKRGMLRLQLIGPQTDASVDFKTAVPSRMYEGFEQNAGSGLSCASYFDTKCDEETGKHALEISAASHAHKPYSSMEIANGKDARFRADESVLSATGTSTSEKTQLPYAPCLLATDGTKTPAQCCSLVSQEYNTTSDTFVMSILNGRSPLSASWHKNDDGVIQLDFNKPFYNAQQHDDYLNKNDLFLNLVGAGSYGFLDTKDDDGVIVKYFIKNLSEDGIPKFMVSVAEMIDTRKTICDESGMAMATEDGLSSMITE